MAAIAVQRLGYLDSIHPGLTGNRERCEGDCTQGLGVAYFLTLERAGSVRSWPSVGQSPLPDRESNTKDQAR
jgi:hypothetical protein